MKLTMWIVNDWLQSYHRQPLIKEGKQNINGIRYLSDDLDLSPEYLYVGYREQYIDQGEYSVICVNSTDIILLDAPDIYEIFNEMQRMLEYYNDWETKILQGINEHSELSYFLKLTTEVLKTGIVISDISHRTMAREFYWGKEDKTPLINGFLEPDVIHFVNEQYRKHLKEQSAYLMDSSIGIDLIYNLYSRDGRLFATIISLEGGEGDQVRSRMQLMNTFGSMMNLWFLVHEKEFARSALFQNILEGKETDPEMIAMRLNGIGWSGTPVMQLFLFRSCTSDDLGANYIARYLESSYLGVETVEFQNEILVVVNYNLFDRAIFTEDLKRQLYRQQVSCGCSTEFTDLTNLKHHFIQAQFAAECGTADEGMIYYFEDYALDYMKKQLQSALDTDVSSPVLNQLKDYDQVNGTDYYHTLYMYLLCERNQTLTAKRLFIHRNSLVYRVGRIEELVNVNLEDERQRMYLLLSYLVRE